MKPLLTIRPEQFDALFEHKLADHIREHLPIQFEALGYDGTRKAVQYGMRRARTHGIASQPGIRAYVQLMFVLGPDFDTDSKLEWVGQALREPTEISRIRSLVAGTEEHLQRRSAEVRGQ